MENFLDDEHWLRHLPYRLDANPTYIASIDEANFVTNTDDLSVVELIIDSEKLNSYDPIFVFSIEDEKTLIDNSPYKRNLFLARKHKIAKEKAKDALRYDEFPEEMCKRIRPMWRERDWKRPEYIQEGCGMMAMAFLSDINKLKQKDEFILGDLPCLWHFNDTKTRVDIDFDKFRNLRKQYLDLTAKGNLTPKVYKTIYDGLKNLVS